MTQTLEITFRQLMRHLAVCLGQHQFPVNDRVSDIADILSDVAIHHELTRRIIREIYKANRCGHLDATIAIEPTLKILGKIQGDLMRSSNSDIDIVRYFSELVHSVSEILRINDDASKNHRVGKPEEQSAVIYRW